MKIILFAVLSWSFLFVSSGSEELVPSEGGQEVVGDLTAYYVKNIKLKDDGSGRKIALTNLDGKRIEYWLENGEYREAEMQAVAQAEKLDGTYKSIYRVREGEWVQLPQGSMGMGNRMNPLVPFHHVAADQKFWPFGSMIYCEELDGRKTMDGKIHDGLFWVADVGGLIKGRNRFDIFVGEEKIFLDLLDKYADPENEPKEHFTVFPRPKAPSAALDPLKGVKPVATILKGKGYRLEGNETTDEAIAEELTKFQKDHPKIPEAEYGNRRGATTLWFLLVSAREVVEEVARN